MRQLLLGLLLIFSCLSLSSSIRWRPRIPSKASKKTAHVPSPTTSTNNNLCSEPLLQIPCTLQLVPNLNDEHDIPKKFAIRTFLDTGAQRTCMSYSTAQRCGLAHLIDQRYAGQAMGVGFCRVLGRIPAHTVRIQFNGRTLLAPAITILESTGNNEVELLMGLDVMRELYAVINFEEELLQLKLAGKNGTIQIPFVRPRQSLGAKKEESSETKEGLKKPLTPALGGDSDNDSDFDDESDGGGEKYDFSGL